MEPSMPSIVPNLDLTLSIYLISSVMIVSISSEKINSMTVMEHLTNYTSFSSDALATLASVASSNPTGQTDQAIDTNLLDEKGSFMVANSICCAILIVYRAIQYLVLGTLRVSEQQHSREAFWEYFTHKSLFLIFFLDVSNQERSAWAIWLTSMGSILLLAKLCKDRFEYISSSPASKRWSLTKISLLMGSLLIIAILCNKLAFEKESRTASLLLLADSSYILIFIISIITKFVILSYDMRTSSIWENRISLVYYADLFFEMIMSTIDLIHQSHLLIIGAWLWPIKFLPLLKMHSLILEMRQRYRRHKNYLHVVNLMETNFSLATPDELSKNSDECAICWDAMESARRLPCGHLFHNSCLRSWLEQDTSCPTCRASLKASQEDSEELLGMEDEFTEAAQSDHQRNYSFHFDALRYINNELLSWLPTIPIEGFM